LVRRSGNVGGSVGLLYYVNTLGAGAACLISTILLFPFLGMQNSVDVAVAINGAVALGALAAYGRDHSAGSDGISTTVARGSGAKPVLGFVPALALAFFGSLVSLSYEIFFPHGVLRHRQQRVCLRPHTWRLPHRSRVRLAQGD
jgi:spermidine synthase